MLSLPKLVLRNLSHYWRVQFSLLFAAAVAVAVLSGALIIGDSIRASLKNLALGKLGKVDSVLVSDLFFREKLASAFPGAAGAIVLNGSAVHATNGERAAQVQVMGVRDSFLSLGDITGIKWNSSGSLQSIVNEGLAREIGAKVGDEILVRVQKPSAVARETFLGERDDTAITLRLRVERIVASGGIGDFALYPSQRSPLGVFVPMELLQKRLVRTGRINTILAPKMNEDPNAMLRHNATPVDAGLKVRHANGFIMVESERIFLSDYEEKLISDLFTFINSRGKGPNFKSLAYLANSMSIDGRSIPYSTVVALNLPSLYENGIYLNQWGSDDLDAKVGDSLTLTYFVEKATGGLTQTSATLRVAGALPMNFLGGSAWVPDFPGISEAKKISDWHSPFPIDFSKIRPKDEEYWDKYRAQPKAFVSLATGQKLWANRFGRVTSIGWSEKTVNAVEVEKRLGDVFDPVKDGLSFRNIRADTLKASQGSSDFAGLFVGFSLFLIFSAAMLIQILFSLGVEQRSREVGLLGAIGFSRNRINRILMAEGAIVALGGAVLGTLLALAYARLLVYALNTIWLGAIGAPFVRMAASPLTLAIGGAAGWGVAMLSILLCTRRLRKLSPRSLLSGRTEVATGKLGKQRIFFLSALILCAIAVLPLVISRAGSAGVQAESFFASGALFLASGLCLFRSWLAGGSPKTARLSIARMGFRSARRRPGRSMLVAGLVASATFLIVAVGANRQSASQEEGLRSGTGGCTLLAESSIPFYGPLGKAVADLTSDASLSQNFRAYAFRLKTGDDASCLNLYQALRPRVLGVGTDFIARGGFEFGGLDNPSSAEKRNPWLLLNRAEKDSVIPAIGDTNTVMWLLHSDLGKEIVVDGRRLRIVGLLKKSIFQSELLISDANFRGAYPHESGWRYFAIETPHGVDPQKISARLEETLEDYGFDATNARDKLASLLNIENTYLSMFQSLGGLGLLLGTLGLSLVVARNLLERQAEFALLSAVGFRRSALAWLAISENMLLLLVGLTTGAFSALVASCPTLMDRAVRFPATSVGGLLALVLALGIIASWVVITISLRRPILRSLTRE